MHRVRLPIILATLLLSSAKAGDFQYGQSFANNQGIGSGQYNSQYSTYQTTVTSPYAFSTPKTIGNRTYHADGTSSLKIGNTTYNSDGSTSYKIGSVTYNSNGTTCQTVGSTVYCF